MRRDPRALLYDIREACTAIREFVGDADFSRYANDRLLRSACERQLEVIGEAMGRLRTTDPTVFARIDVGRAVIEFRNRLIHGYHSVDSRIVWDVIRNKLPALEELARVLLAELELRG